MITDALMKTLWEPAEARAFLFVCDDGSKEVMPPEGGEFQFIDCKDPLVYPLAGGPLTGRRASKMHEPRRVLERMRRPDLIDPRWDPDPKKHGLKN